MADNSVTIALKLDASQFNAGIAQAQASLNSMSMSGRGRGGGGGRGASSGIGTIDFGLGEQTKRTTKVMKTMNKDIEGFMVRFTSMLRGNLAPSNVLGVVRSAQGIVGGLAGGKPANPAGAMAGIEGIGSEGATAAAASTAAAGGGGSIGAILGQLVGLVVGIAAVLALIAIGISALIIGVSAVTLAFKPVLKILQAIGKVLGATLLPISLVIMTMLQPLIWVLMPFVRLMSAIFRPLRTALANFFKNTKTQIASGDIMGILGSLFDAVMPALTGMANAIGTMLMPLFSMLATWIVGFLTINLSEVKNTLENLLGAELGGVVSTLINVLYYAASAITGFVAQLVGKGQFDKMFGAGQFDKIKKVNEGFSAGADIGAVIQGIWNELSKFWNALVANPADTIWGLVVSTVTAVWGKFNDILPYVPGGTVIQSSFQMVFDALGKLSELIITVYTFTFGMDGKSGIWKQLTDAIPVLANAMTWMANLIRSFSLPSYANPNTNSVLTPTHNDFIMRPGQGAVSFSSNDTVFGLKNPGSMAGGGNTTVININVEGNVDDKTRRVIVDEVQRVLAEKWRAIAR